MSRHKPIPPVPDSWFEVPGRYEVRDCGYETPCWVWLKALNNGYGQVMVGCLPNRRNVRAHRLYYERVHGPLDYSQDLELDHLCRIRACVNPGHLEPVTSAENIRRSLPSQKRKLTDEQVRELRESRDSNRAAARRLGVSHTLVYAVRKGSLYRTVTT